MAGYERLFSPIDVGGLRLKNRIVFPPVSTQFGLTDGYASEKHLKWYGAIAAGGAGLIVIEAVGVHKRPSGTLLRLYDDSYKTGFAKIVDAIHAHDIPCGVQLVHWPSVSALYRMEPTNMPVAELEEMIAQFVAAAKRAFDCGVDFVQLHAAHSYSFASLLSPVANRRTDEYGGTIKKRAKALLDCIAAIKAECGSAARVNARINGEDYVLGGVTLLHSRETAQLLQKTGIFLLDVSVGARYEDGHWYAGYSGQRAIPPADFPEACNIHVMAEIKKVVDIPVQGVGRIPTAQVAERILEDGLVDVVGVARPIITDPEWPKKFAEGRHKEVTSCIYCCHCIDTQRHFRPLSCARWNDGLNGDPEFAYVPVPAECKMEESISYDKLPYKGGKGSVYVAHVEPFPPRD